MACPSFNPRRSQSSITASSLVSALLQCFFVCPYSRQLIHPSVISSVFKNLVFRTSHSFYEITSDHDGPLLFQTLDFRSSLQAPSCGAPSVSILLHESRANPSEKSCVFNVASGQTHLELIFSITAYSKGFLPSKGEGSTDVSVGGLYGRPPLKLVLVCTSYEGRSRGLLKIRLRVPPAGRMGGIVRCGWAVVPH